MSGKGVTGRGPADPSARFGGAGFASGDLVEVLGLPEEGLANSFAEAVVSGVGGGRTKQIITVQYKEVSGGGRSRSPARLCPATYASPPTRTTIPSRSITAVSGRRRQGAGRAV